MTVLLDSHAVYWWTIGSDRLYTQARSLIENKANAIVVSAVTFDKLDNKMRLNRLDLKPQESRAAVTESGLQTLAITDVHAELAAAFDWAIAIRGTGFSLPRRGWSAARSSRRIWRSTRYCMSGSGKGQWW